MKRERGLLSEFKASVVEFPGEALVVDAFEQARAERSMDFDGQADDLVGETWAGL